MEWEMGAFYTDEYLSESYLEMLSALLSASEEDRHDPRMIPFLMTGFLAHRRQHADDRQAGITSPPRHAPTTPRHAPGGAKRTSRDATSGIHLTTTRTVQETEGRGGGGGGAAHIGSPADT